MSELKDMISKCCAFVEATTEERHYLWKDYAKDSEDEGKWRPKQRVSWNYNRKCSGMMPQIGEFAGEAITLDIVFVDIEDKTVAFWWPCSNVVNYRVVQRWLEDVLPEETKRVDAGSFHHVVSAILDKEI